MSSPATDTRTLWCGHAERMARPLLELFSKQRFRADFDPEGRQPAERACFAALEALARLLNGIAPWLELDDDTDPGEATLRAELAAFARQAVASVADPESPDFANWAREGSQPLVDAAFLAQAFLRAPRALWEPLPDKAKARFIAGLEACRVVDPAMNNWQLFAATIEAFLFRQGRFHDPMRVTVSLQFHSDWYMGDGIYGDGARLHADYYNSYVIQPMLLEILDAFPDYQRYEPYREPMRQRARRYAAIQERLISPGGAYPPLGRSIAYRTGAFQHLALMALRQDLPEGLNPAQVRCALTAVIERSLAAKGTYADDGFLTIGFCGNQPSQAERYISRASCYLASFVFLPLGLPPAHPFWADPDEDWTAKKLYAGPDLPADHALHD
jgi:hypothetical protein